MPTPASRGQGFSRGHVGRRESMPMRTATGMAPGTGGGGLALWPRRAIVVPCGYDAMANPG
jgi:hypothetical protein